MYAMNGMGWGMGFGWILGMAVLIVLIWALTKGINAGQNTPSNRKQIGT